MLIIQSAECISAFAQSERIVKKWREPNFAEARGVKPQSLRLQKPRWSVEQSTTNCRSRTRRSCSARAANPVTRQLSFLLLKNSSKMAARILSSRVGTLDPKSKQTSQSATYNSSIKPVRVKSSPPVHPKDDAQDKSACNKIEIKASAADPLLHIWFSDKEPISRKNIQRGRLPTKKIAASFCGKRWGVASGVRQLRPPQTHGIRAGSAPPVCPCRPKPL